MFRFISLLIILLAVVCVDNSIIGAQMIGLLALVYSFLTIRAVKGHIVATVLFSIIFYINASAYVLGPLTQGMSFNEYQWDMWNSQYDAIGMKNMLISSYVFFLFMSRVKDNPAARNINYRICELESNSLVSVFCLIVVFIISVTGFNGSVGDNYISNDNPLFEYSILLLIVAWYYSGNSQFLKFLWVVVGLLYVLIAVLAGDRSSAFMFILIVVLYFLQSINIRIVLSFGILAIFAANFIEMYRMTGGIAFSVHDILYRGLQVLFSNTAAQSFYSGITIYHYIDMIDNSLSVFFNWIISLFSGSLFIDRSDIDLPKLARIYNINGGGGFFHSYFYLLFGYVGVALGSLVTAVLLRGVYFKWKTPYSTLLGIIIVGFSLRWYLYTPTTLYRTCVINFAIIFFACKCFNSLIKK